MTVFETLSGSRDRGERIRFRLTNYADVLDAMAGVTGLIDLVDRGKHSCESLGIQYYRARMGSRERSAEMLLGMFHQKGDPVPSVDASSRCSCKDPRGLCHHHHHHHHRISIPGLTRFRAERCLAKVL